MKAETSYNVHYVNLVASLLGEHPETWRNGLPALQPPRDSFLPSDSV